MPIEVGIWRLGDKVERVKFSPMPDEKRLEDILAEDISILDPNLLVIGRQVLTGCGNYIDLLAMDADGNLVVIELKRDRTPRDVVAQLLEYGSWVRGLQNEDIATIFDSFLKRYYPERERASLDDVFRESFGVQEMPEVLNESHELVIVASELDASTERIVNYLADEYGAAINAVFFRFFRDGSNEYLSRVWLIDPGEAEAKVIEKRERVAWNGEFYVSFGEDERRHWSDAREYGFISAGGGSWYSRTLDILEPGNRIWVNVPAQGYVGVGLVTREKTPATEFRVKDESGREVPLAETSVETPKMLDTDCPKEEWEYLVGVDWIKTVPVDAAIKEKGFFGNQNTVAKPRTKKWAHTVERLKKRFGIDE